MISSRSSLKEIRSVGLVGGGVMGSQIAHLLALNGIHVVIKDVSNIILNQTILHIDKQLDEQILFNKRRVKREIDRIEGSHGFRLTDLQKATLRRKLRTASVKINKKETLSHITPTLDYDDFQDCDIVIEAVIEDLDLKKRIFKELDNACLSGVILASNTSTISISKLASCTRRPEMVIGMHFFNPPLALPLIEIIPGVHTASNTVESVLDFSRGLRNYRRMMEPMIVKDLPGFVVNRLLLSMLREAFELYHYGAASFEDIDKALKMGSGMPMGPFELADLIGLDVLYDINRSMKLSARGKTMRGADRVLKHMSSMGLHGRKTGKGFYVYNQK
ncbi:MAG: 3-hydroxyacyl-CoA dehydrogenase [Thaumarchaeota archaeon]|nr:3-hydroxyacyl-CoA dehydrogenase [Nitrososphaerota archaeon]